MFDIKGIARMNSVPVPIDLRLRVMGHCHRWHGPDVGKCRRRSDGHKLCVEAIGDDGSCTCLLALGPTMTTKIGVYLTDDVAKQLRVAVRRPGVTKSSIVNAALRRFLDPAPVKEHGEEVLERLRRLAKKHRQLHREVQILVEMMALFVRYFLTINPPLPESEQNAAEMRGRERYAVFVRQIARRITSDSRLVSDVMETIVTTRPDLVARAAARHGSATGGATRPAATDAIAQTSKPLEDVAHG